jgi:hypothetical protein
MTTTFQRPSPMQARALARQIAALRDRAAEHDKLVRRAEEDLADARADLVAAAADQEDAWQARRRVAELVADPRPDASLRPGERRPIFLYGEGRPPELERADERFLASRARVDLAMGAVTTHERQLTRRLYPARQSFADAIASLEEEKARIEEHIQRGTMPPAAPPEAVRPVLDYNYNGSAGVGLPPDRVHAIMAAAGWHLVGAPPPAGALFGQMANLRSRLARVLR